jgi:hypothetical protein
MRKQERPVRWEPDIGLPRMLDPSLLTNDSEHGLQLTLAEPSAKERVFSVRFDKALAFRSASESYRLKFMEPLTDLPWPTFKVEASRWLDWFHDETYGIYRDWPIQHFVFLGLDVVDVLSTLEPRFAEIERASSIGRR